MLYRRCLLFFPESSISANMHFSFVSVVMMALWTSSPPDASAPAHCSMPLIIMFIGIGWPMTPVEYTSTSSGFTSRSSAVFSAIESASCMPWSPVHAFALPLFMIMARVVGFWTCFISVSTGAACYDVSSENCCTHCRDFTVYESHVFFTAFLSLDCASCCLVAFYTGYAFSFDYFHILPLGTSAVRGALALVSGFRLVF